MAGLNSDIEGDAMFSSPRNASRTQEIKSELLNILIPESSESSDQNVRDYLEKIVNIHFQNGSSPSRSIINIATHPSTPLNCLEQLIGLYVDQTYSRVQTGKGQIPEAWCREWKNIIPNQTSDPDVQSPPREGLARSGLDDRELMIALGAGPGAFLPESSGVSYHLIQVPGKVGVYTLGELIQSAQADSLVKLTRTTKGHYTRELECTDKDSSDNTLPTSNANIATMIIGPRNKKNSEGNGVKIWTAHAGLPAKTLPMGVTRNGDFVFGENSGSIPDMIPIRTYLLEQLGRPTLPDSSPVLLTVHQASALLGKEYIVRLPPQ
jgi:hypothetical protein